MNDDALREAVLIVDDEESVRRTFREWLAGAGFDITILTAADAEEALRHASTTTIDLAILDWNLGAGSDGLQLLQDLYDWHPDIVAIMATGYAHRATPLDALRMGVRDYLDKNQDLSRDSFLAAVRRQLERIRPAKRQRAFNDHLREFRETIEKILPLVQATSALNDPVPLPRAVQGLFRFVIRATGAETGVLIVRHSVGDAESYRAFTTDGEPYPGELVPFAESLAASVMSMQEPCAMGREELAAAGKLQPFEKDRRSMLAAPLNVGPGTLAVIELFDKAGGSFTHDDRQLAQAAADFGSEILRHALAEKQHQQTLLDAIAAALGATEKLSAAAGGGPEQPPPAAIMDTLRHGLGAALDPTADPQASLDLAEAVRVLAVRHGPSAVRHCTRVIRTLGEMLDSATGLE